ncbi:MAG: conjugal transfer protein TraI, partial [Dysgonomonas mossii]
MYRLIILVESRIRRNVYVRFGGEYLETDHSNMIRRWVLSLLQEVQKVYNQGKQYYDALKAVNGLVKDAKKVQRTILMVGEISDIYVHSFQKMLSDPNYSIE